jgi:hypothetical protein
MTGELDIHPGSLDASYYCLACGVNLGTKECADCGVRFCDSPNCNPEYCRSCYEPLCSADVHDDECPMCKECRMVNEHDGFLDEPAPINDYEAA